MTRRQLGRGARGLLSCCGGLDTRRRRHQPPPTSASPAPFYTIALPAPPNSCGPETRHRHRARTTVRYGIRRWYAGWEVQGKKDLTDETILTQHQSTVADANMTRHVFILARPIRLQFMP
ncbi:hypothetical protein PVAP13_8KG252004 [Panicum virgatum]|uniref:Uncharacterized protein n=1 Tax=Panicum virgatum TaxID=38727 RepID=A0A8T0PMS0_PANVG|nr:hypothetical protein PVAP13_8KG252004 [Panicum virgatum]